MAKRDVCEIRGMGTVAHKEPVLSRCMEQEMMPSGITDSQTEFISSAGRCQLTKEIYAPCQNKPLPCLLYLRDITLSVVSYTSNKQSVVGDSFRNVYRSSEDHVALVPSFYF